MLASPWVMLRKRPVTVLLLTQIGLTLMWLGYIILTTHFSAGQLYGFTGPRTFASMSVWGWMFVATGAVSILRIPLLDMQFVSLFLHLPVMAVTMAWSVSFDVGPPTTGQATYTFFAAIVAISPFMTSIILYFSKQQGLAFVATPKAKYSTSEYMLRSAPYHDIAYQASVEQGRATSRDSDQPAS